MNTSIRPLRMTAVLFTTCLGSALLAGVPAFAQSQSAVGQTDTQTSGAGPRGTKAGPSTNPSHVSRPAPEARAPRGTKAGPSTNPAKASPGTTSR